MVPYTASATPRMAAITAADDVMAEGALIAV
jgi:hypothetical protein